MSGMASRYTRNRARGIKDQAIALPLEPKANDRMAAAAEHFIADRYGLPRTKNDRPDKGHDFKLGPRTTLDVKWSPRLDAALLVPLKKVRATVYVLVVGDKPSEFRLAGFAWSGKVRASLGDKGHGPTHVVPQSELHPNVDLLMATQGFAVQS
jgi:hypothetical protein